MNDTADLTRAFELQSGACAALGSPFSAALLARAARDVADDGPLKALLAPWAEASTRTLMSEATPLRWLGCLHDLVLSGAAPDLAAAYPTPEKPGDEAAAWAAARQAMIDRPELFRDFMGHEPQTNEVRRSACLLPGFLTLARETSLPLRIFEIGASAGLNQLWDRYHYDFAGAGTWGDDGSSVRLDAEWRGQPADLSGGVLVVERAACDRKPVDIRDSVARRRLKAYVWADQLERLARLDAATAMARAADTRVDAEDAVSWTAARATPADGAVTVLFHSVFWQYVPAESQAALTGVIAALGAGSTAVAPFAWLRMEPSPDNMAVMELRLNLWPAGEDRLLAHVHPHGAWVDWGAGGGVGSSSTAG